MNTRPSQGFTLVEIVVATALLAVIFTVVLTTVLSGLKIYRADQGRTAASSNVRGTMDVLGSDVKQVGENLSSDFPALGVQMVGGNTVLTLNRALTDAPMPLCAPPSATIEVTGGPTNTSATSYGGISNLPASCRSDTASLTATATTLAVWQALITKGTNSGYLYDPLTLNGGFVTLTGATASQLTYSGSLPANGSVGWNPLRSSATTPPRDQRVYLLEQRIYSLSGTKLQLAVNGGAPADAAANITSFVATPYVTSGTSIVAATLPFPSPAQPWRTLSYLDVQLGSTQDAGFGRTVNRTLTYRLVPRNTFSNDR